MASGYPDYSGQSNPAADYPYDYTSITRNLEVGVASGSITLLNARKIIIDFTVHISGGIPNAACYAMIKSNGELYFLYNASKGNVYNRSNGDNFNCRTVAANIKNMEFSGIMSHELFLPEEATFYYYSTGHSSRVFFKISMGYKDIVL